MSTDIKISGYLDFANHNPDATEMDIKELCQKVIEYGFNSAFVNPIYVGMAKEMLVSGRVGTIVSFPLGQDLSEIKVAAAKANANEGADELDVSMNVSWTKEAKWDRSLEEMKRVVAAVKEVNADKIVKFILETGYLSVDEIKKGSEMIVESGADFVKTCSGMGPRGGTVEDVKTIRDAIGDKIRIKVAGGVVNFEQARALLDAGANRIGTSHAVEIATQKRTVAGDTGE